MSAGWRHYTERLECIAAMDALAPLRGRTVVVVGSTGALGSAVMRVLGHVAEQHPRTVPVGVARRPGRPVPGTIFVAGSATDASTYAQLPPPEFVLHIAGPTSDYLARAWETVDVTINGLRRVVDYARSSEGLVFVSSTRVYGPHCFGELTEDSAAVIDPASPLNIYDSSKRLAESLLMLEHARHGLASTVVRLTNVYGPFSPNPAASVIGGFVRDAMSSRKIVLRGHPDTTRNYCFVADAAEGLLLALARGERGGTYIIGSTEHVSNAAFARAVADLVTPDVELSISPEAISAPRSVTTFSIDRARQELGYSPQGTLTRCLPVVVDWTIQAMSEN